MIKHILSHHIELIIFVVLALVLLMLKDTLFFQYMMGYGFVWFGLVLITAIIVLLKPRPTKSTIEFPSEYSKVIEQALPHQAIQLYQQWLRQSLNAHYRQAYQAMPGEEVAHASKSLANALVDAFTRIPKGSLYQLIEARNKDNACIALIFFTVIINGLLKPNVVSTNHCTLSNYRAIFTCLVLNQAKDFLFREHYRLYELASLIESQWDNIYFNADRVAILQMALSAPLPLNQPQSQHQLLDYFFSWLKRKIKQESSHTEPFLFCDEQDKQQRLFITEKVLHGFCQKAQIKFKVLRQLLRDENHTDGKQYVMHGKDQSTLTLLAIKLTFKINNTIIAYRKIEEVI